MPLPKLSYVLIFLLPVFFLPAISVADQPGATAYWKLLGSHNGEKSISKYYESQVNGTAIRFNGAVGLLSAEGLSGKLIRISRRSATRLGTATWKMNMDDGYQISFYLDTNFGKRQLTYTQSKTKPLKVTQHIFHFQLNSETGQWLDIVRNLHHDLQKAEPGNAIRAINFGLVKGSGAIADFNFRSLPANNRFAKNRLFALQSTKRKNPITITQKNNPIGLDTQTKPITPVAAAALPTGPRRSIRLPTKQPRQLSITVDGKLNEALWQQAPVAGDFRVNEKRSPAQDLTEVRVLSDSNYLYFSFRCFDDQPNLVSAIKTLRDGGLGIDDSVSVKIDTYKDFNTAATYSINAIGTQDNQLAGGSANKIQWKGDWQGAAAKTSYGWSAELAIPFNVLRFNNRTDSFGINFSRYQNRTSEHSHWVKPSTQKNRDPLGLLTGLSLPESSTSRQWTLMPYVVAGKNVADRDGTVQDESFHGGLTLRYQPTSNLTGLLELLPDFSQVESQVSDIDFSYNEKAQDDYRPFFQEGAAYFGNDTQYFYSRRVPDFNSAIKTFTQDGKNILGALAVSSDDGRFDIQTRYRRNISANFGAGLTAVSFRDNNNQSLLVAANADRKFSSGLFFDIKSAALSNELEANETNGNSANILLGFGKDEWEVGVKSDHYSRGFLPKTGLLNSDLPGTRSAELYASIYNEGKHLIKQINGDVSLIRRQTRAGEDQNDGLYVSTNFEVLGISRVQLTYNQYRYRPVSDTPGVFLDTVNDDKYWSANLDFNIYSSQFGYGAFYADGVLGGGDYRYASAYAWFNPTDSTNLKISTEELESFGRYRQTTLSGGWDFSTADGVVARLSLGEDYRLARVAYRRKVNSGVDVFVAAEKDQSSDGELTAKFVWTF